MNKKLNCLILLINIFSAQLLWGQSTQQMTADKMQFNIQKIEDAISSTKIKIKNIHDAKFLPDLYLSLADFYVTKSKYQYALKITTNKNIPIEQLDFTFEKRLKQEAINTYDLLIEKFPSFSRRDKAMFFKAHEQRELQAFQEMVSTLNQLATEYPKSEYWEESQIILGDYYLEQKKVVDLALDFYKKILDRPTTAFTPLAFYKMGWCYINMEKFTNALLSFENVLIKFKDINLTELPENLRKTDVRADALVAIVWPYSEVDIKKLENSPYGGIDRAKPLAYFKSLSPNKAAYLKALRKLGRRFSVKSKFLEATQVYFELLRLSPSLTDRMDLIERVYVSMKNTLKPWPIKGFVQEIVKTMPIVRYSEDLKRNEKKKAFYDFEIYARDIATRQDKQARETKQEDDYLWAIKDYEDYLWTFKKKKFYQQMELNLATLYFLSNNFVKAGNLFENLSRVSKSKKDKTEHLQSSMQAYIAALKAPDSLNELELTQARYGLRGSGAKFMQINKRHKAVPDILFSIAQSYYDERQFDKAVKYFKIYIKKYPKNENVPTAANMILDSFNQIEDYKSIVREGKNILKNKKINFSQLKDQIGDIVQQAEMKLVQKKSGDFGSKDYASNLLKMATKYKGSSLGDKALYEAFLALKSKRDEKAYQVGTELALKHKKSKLAINVITDMGQMALASADFKRAALYFELFFERYPANAQANNLLKSAANMRELMGDYKIASEDYEKLKMFTDAARMDYLGQFWTNLVRSSTRAKGIWRDYWKGIALYRTRGLRAASSYLSKAASYRGGAADENEAAAHSLYLLSLGKLEEYKKIQIELGREAQAVNSKASGLKALEQSLNQVIQFGNGRWTIAALYGLGQAYNEFKLFLVNSPVPNGVDKKAYRQAISQQANVYGQSASNFFSQCRSAAEKNNVFTLFVRGCLSAGKLQVDEEKDTTIVAKARDSAPSGADALRKKLLDKPGELDLLDQLAYLYLQNKDYSMAELVMKRSLELKSNRPESMINLGVIKLFKNQPTEAYYWFNEAYKTNANAPGGSLGLAALYKTYAFKNKLKSISSKAKRSPKPNRFIHPSMKEI